MYQVVSKGEPVASSKSFKTAKNTAESVAGFYEGEVCVFDDNGKEVYSTEVGAMWRFRKC